MNSQDNTFIILAAIAVIAATLGFYKDYKKRTYLKKNGIKTTGVVFTIEREFSMGDLMKAPLIRFVTTDGTWITGKAQQMIRSSVSRYREGAEVTVYYNPLRPDEFIISS